MTLQTEERLAKARELAAELKEEGRFTAARTVSGLIASLTAYQRTCKGYAAEISDLRQMVNRDTI